MIIIFDKMLNIRALNKFVKNEFPNDINIFHLKNYIAESVFEYSEKYSDSTNSILTTLPIKLVKEWNNRIKHDYETQIDMIIYWGIINDIKFTKHDDSTLIYSYNNHEYLININKPIRRVRINYGKEFYLNYFTKEVLEQTLLTINEKFLSMFHQNTLDKFSSDSLDILRQYVDKFVLKTRSK